MRKISLRVNGVVRDAEVEPRQLLVYFLRETLGLTGTKVGCDTSSCGACTVLLNGKSVKSCTVLAVQADGSEVTTIEGLARDGEMHPLQKAFHANHGLQCGYWARKIAAHQLEVAEEDLVRRGPLPGQGRARQREDDPRDRLRRLDGPQPPRPPSPPAPCRRTKWAPSAGRSTAASSQTNCSKPSRWPAGPTGRTRVKSISGKSMNFLGWPIRHRRYDHFRDRDRMLLRREPLTSPVQDVREGFTAVYGGSRIRPSVQLRRGFRLTPTSIANHALTGVMLGVC